MAIIKIPVFQAGGISTVGVVVLSRMDTCAHLYCTGCRLAGALPFFGMNLSGYPFWSGNIRLIPSQSF